MKQAYLGFSVLALLLTGCEFSLAGDITPPPDSIISGEVSLAPVQAPFSAPDLAAGAEIYANSCAPCHGASGLGDGGQADQLPFFPTALADPDLARAASPADWFRVLRDGRPPRYMPPFESALTIQQRWDVLAYVFSLGWDQEILARGEQLYLEHEEEVEELLEVIPPMEVNLDLVANLGITTEDAHALTAYLQSRGLGIEQPDVQTVDSVADATAPTSFARIRGHVIYTNRDQLPERMEARLYGFDHTRQIVLEVTQFPAGGSYAFEDVPLATGRIFFVQVDYQGVAFFSEFIQVDEQEGIYDLNVPIYDITSETDQLVIERLQLFFDFPRLGVIRVVESVVISNLGDRAVVPDESGKPVLHFSLPPQAVNLSFDDGELGERYVRDETGFGDTWAVIPGIHSRELYFAYELPYANELTFPMQFDLAAKKIVVLLPEGFSLRKESLELQGMQEVNGAAYLLYAGNEGYFPGDEIPLEIKGSHPLGGGSGLLQDDRLLVGLVALTAAIGFVWLWLRRLPVPSLQAKERILAEIVALDERYQRGQMTKVAYTKKRRSLKARLRRELEIRFLEKRFLERKIQR